MPKINALVWTALILLIIGGLNWGLIGLIKLNLVTTLFGQIRGLTRIIYVLVGLSALYIAALSPKLVK